MNSNKFEGDEEEGGEEEEAAEYLHCHRKKMQNDDLERDAESWAIFSPMLRFLQLWCEDHNLQV
jgi:hypothetical protein